MWPVKENQPQLYGDIAAFFASEEEGTVARTVEKDHGRIEQRCLRSSTGLPVRA